MRNNHYEEISRILRETSKQLSWSAEAKQAIEKTYAEKIRDSLSASRRLSEAAAMTDLLIFALPRGTSLLYGEEFAKVFRGFGVGMPESFYLNRGFSERDEKAGGFKTSKIKLLF